MEFNVAAGMLKGYSNQGLKLMLSEANVMVVRGKG